MVKHRKHKSACTAHAKVSGNHVTVKATCPVKSKTTTVVKRVKARRTKHTEVPSTCKGLKKKARKECAKRVCAQRPQEYRTDCFKKAGIR